LVTVERFFLCTFSNTTTPQNCRSIGEKTTGTTETLSLYSLTLTTDPAGYGKSILISRWLETNDCPSAWLSLVDILEG